MSGGERNERKRKQQQQQRQGQRQSGKGGQQSRSSRGAKAVASARGVKTGRNRVVVAVVVVVVLAVAIIGGVLYSTSQHKEQDSIADQIRTELKIGDNGVSATKVPQEKLAPRIAGDGVVEAGNPSAVLTADLYEDFICPYCGQLYKQSNTELEKAIDDGKIKLRYHLLGFLDGNSSPPGYSSRAASAALCSVDDGRFRPYYEQLFSKQPEEDGPGYSDQQLTKTGQDVGLGADFAKCVSSGKYRGAVRDGTQQGEQRLQQLSGGKSVGTPTVVVNNHIVRALGEANWLSNLIGAKGGKD
ncbi:MAG: DsbA family protein [Sciscionella sp.]